MQQGLVDSEVRRFGPGRDAGEAAASARNHQVASSAQYVCQRMIEVEVSLRVRRLSQCWNCMGIWIPSRTVCCEFHVSRVSA